MVYTTALIPLALFYLGRLLPCKQWRLYPFASSLLPLELLSTCHILLQLFDGAYLSHQSVHLLLHRRSVINNGLEGVVVP